MRHVVAWVVAWLSLFWLWLLLAGEWNRQEWVSAAAAAAVAATVGEYARAKADVRVRVPLPWVGKAATVPLMVLVDFGIVAWALLASAPRRRVVRGTFRTRSFPAGGDDPAGVGVRAWVMLAATYSPNAYVVDIDEAKDTVLIHDLVPFRRSEEPA